MPAAPTRLRVLLIVEACNPAWTSVPLVGYNFAHALARRPDLDVTVVSHVRNRAALEASPLRTLTRLEIVDTEWLSRPMYQFASYLRGGETTAWTVGAALAWPAYMAFEHALYQRFRPELARGAFDLIHRVIPLSPLYGSPLASWTATPMLIGPLNGGLPFPKEFPELAKQEREWLAPVRKAYRYLPFYTATYRRLAGVISGSRQTASEVPAFFKGRRFFLPENGIDPDRFPLAAGWPEPDGRFRMVTVGRLVPLKGIDLIIEAMRGSEKLADSDLVVIGDGPQRAELEALRDKSGLGDRVRLLGWLDQKALAAELRRSQLFVFPSLKDFGGGVVLEALACGLPAVVVDYGGPAELVTPGCGVAIPMSPRAALVAKLRETLEGLRADPDRCRRMGAAAVAHVGEHFVWSAKAEKIVGMYRRLLDGRHNGA